MPGRGYGGAAYGHNDYYGGGQLALFEGSATLVFSVAGGLSSNTPLSGALGLSWAATAGLATALPLEGSAGLAWTADGSLLTALPLTGALGLVWALNGTLLGASTPDGAVSLWGLLSRPTSSATVAALLEPHGLESPEADPSTQLGAPLGRTRVGQPPGRARTRLGASSNTRTLRGPSGGRLE